MSWPPESLTTCNIDDLINECELVEVMPQKSQGRQSIPVRTVYKYRYCHTTDFC